MKKFHIFKNGFTLVELMVSVGIFVFMTAFLISKYGTFNQGILLTNLAYDVALTLRNAQSYGLDVKSQPIGVANFSNTFKYGYGVHFNVMQNTKMIFFVDIYADGIYTTGEEISTYNIKRGSTIYKLCAGDNEASCSGSSTSLPSLDVTFKRPDPNAIIMSNAIIYNYAEITLKSSDGGIKKVIVRSTGQISVIN